MFSCDHLALEAQDAPLPEKLIKGSEDATTRKRKTASKRSPGDALKRNAETSRRFGTALQGIGKRRKMQMDAEEITKCRLCDLRFQTELELEEHLISLLHHRALDSASEERCDHRCILCRVTCVNLNAFVRHLSIWSHKANCTARRNEIAVGTYKISTEFRSFATQDPTRGRSSDNTPRQNGRDSSKDSRPRGRWNGSNPHRIDRRQPSNGPSPRPFYQPGYDASRGWLGYSRGRMHYQSNNWYANRGAPGWRGRYGAGYSQRYKWHGNLNYGRTNDMGWWNDDIPNDQQFEQMPKERSDNNCQNKNQWGPPVKGNKRMVNLLAQAQQTIHSSPLTSMPKKNKKSTHTVKPVQHSGTADNQVSSSTDRVNLTSSSASSGTSTSSIYTTSINKTPDVRKANKLSGKVNRNGSSFTQTNFKNFARPASNGTRKMQHLLAQARRATHGAKAAKMSAARKNTSQSSVGAGKGKPRGSNRAQAAASVDKHDKSTDSICEPRRAQSFTNFSVSMDKIMGNLTNSSSCFLSASSDNPLPKNKDLNKPRRPPLLPTPAPPCGAAKSSDQPLTTVTTVTTVNDSPLSLNTSLTTDMFKESRKEIDVQLAAQPGIPVRSHDQVPQVPHPDSPDTWVDLGSFSWSQGMGTPEKIVLKGRDPPRSAPSSARKERQEHMNSIRTKFRKILDDIGCDDDLNLQEKVDGHTSKHPLPGTGDTSYASCRRPYSSQEAPSMEDPALLSSPYDGTSPTLLSDSPSLTIDLTDTPPTAGKVGERLAEDDVSSPRYVQRTCTSDIETPPNKKRPNLQPNFNKARSRLTSKNKDGLSPEVSSDAKQAKLRKLLQKYDRVRKNSASASLEVATPTRHEQRRTPGPRFGIDLNVVNKAVGNIEDIPSLATSGEFVEITEERTRSLSESDGNVPFTTAATDSVIIIPDEPLEPKPQAERAKVPDPPSEKMPEKSKVDETNSRLLMMSEREEVLHAAIRSLDMEDANLQADLDRTVGAITELQIRLTKLQERKATVHAVKRGNEDELGQLRQERLRLLRGKVASENPCPNLQSLFQDLPPSCRRLSGMPYARSTPAPQSESSFSTTVQQGLSESCNQSESPFSAPCSKIASPEVTSTVSDPSLARSGSVDVDQQASSAPAPPEPQTQAAPTSLTVKNERPRSPESFPQATTKAPSEDAANVVKEEYVEPGNTCTNSSSHQNGTTDSTLRNCSVTQTSSRCHGGNTETVPQFPSQNMSNSGNARFRTTSDNSCSSTSAEFYSFTNSGDPSMRRGFRVVDDILAKYTSNTNGDSNIVQAEKPRSKRCSTPKRNSAPKTNKTPTRYSPRKARISPGPKRDQTGHHTTNDVPENTVTKSPKLLKTHDASLVAMSLTSMGLLTCSLDESLALHSFETGQRSSYSLQATPTAMITFNRGFEVVCVAMQKIVPFSDPSNGGVVVNKVEHVLSIYALKAHGASTQAMFYEVENVKMKTRVLCMQADKGTLFCGMRDGMVAIIALDEFGKVDDEVDVLECHSFSAVTCLTTGREGARRILCCGSTDCTVSVRDAKEGLLLRTIQGHSKTVTCLQLVHHVLFSAGVDRQVLSHDVNTGQLLHRFLGHAGAVRSLHVAGSCMITLCSDKHIRFYNTENGRLVKKGMATSSLPLFTCVRSVRGRHFAYVGCHDGTVVQDVPFPNANQQNSAGKTSDETRRVKNTTEANEGPIRLGGDYHCKWADCSHQGTFQNEDQLRKHVLDAHVNMYELTEYSENRAAMTLSVGTCCQWDECIYYFAPGLDTIVDVQTHVQTHFQKEP